MIFAANLKRLRQEAKISQSKLAKAVDIPQATISDLELGKHEPKIGIAKKIADYFGKSLDDMMEEEK